MSGEENRTQVEPNPNDSRQSEDSTYGLPPLLTVEEVAHFLRMNVKTVYAAVSAGEMPGRKVRQRTVILRDALLQWLRTQERVRPRRKRGR
jgi:excisionase family DNA binding protein